MPVLRSIPYDANKKEPNITPCHWHQLYSETKGNVSYLKRLVLPCSLYYIARDQQKKWDLIKLLFKYSIEQLDMN